MKIDRFDRDYAAYDLLSKCAMEVALTDIPAEALRRNADNYDFLTVESRWFDLLDAYATLRRAAGHCVGDTYGR